MKKKAKKPKAPKKRAPKKKAPKKAAKRPAAKKPKPAEGPRPSAVEFRAPLAEAQTLPAEPPPADDQAGQAQQPAPAPLCQSCGMPMDHADKLGTNADGSRSSEYCIFCFRGGGFTRPDLTVEQMATFVAGVMLQKTGTSTHDAEAQAMQFLPQLKRWRT